MKKNIRIAIGLSGGVDSSVAASLLVHAGYDVTAVFLKTFEHNNALLADCPWEEDLAYAKKVASQLAIPLVIWNYEREYKKEVLQYFTNELTSGRTPNPDILCNSVIKFGLCLERALAEGFDFFATGHYAQTVCKINKQIHLLRGSDATKDQSYFLSNLSQEQLSRTLFPVGHMTKKEVRKLAAEYTLATAVRKDSQGICFIGKVNYASFVDSFIPQATGTIQDAKGVELGKHTGCQHFTIGQRYGLHIGGLKEPMYVYNKDIAKQILYVCRSGDPHLQSIGCVMERIHWIHPPREFPFSAKAQVRYRQEAIDVTIHKEGEHYRAQFASPVRAVAPGQWLVLYAGVECIGSGIIKKTLRIA